MRRMYSLKQLQEIADERTKSLVEGGTLENAKPIYFHPIYIQDDATTARYTFIILDNQKTAYTFSTFKAKAKELMDNGALLQVNGYFILEETIHQVYILGKYSNSYRLYGVSPSGSRSYIVLDDITDTQFEDGVNKIN